MLPLIKWAGGKRKFAVQITNLLGNQYNNYYEPFVGGAAILLHMEAHNAICYDINPELINMYNVIKKHPKDLIEELREYSTLHENSSDIEKKELYYNTRGLDRNRIMYRKLSNVEKAARFMYLNKTCYNGLWRVNRNGQNNVPYGRYVNPKILSEEEILAASQYFNTSNVTFEVSDYQNVRNLAQAGDVVYFDPPYDVEEGQSSFVEYAAGGFNRENQRELKQLCDELVQRGVIVGISNSNTQFIRNLYMTGPYDFYELYDDMRVIRTIGGTPSSRGERRELFILGRLNNNEENE